MSVPLSTLQSGTRRSSSSSSRGRGSSRQQQQHAVMPYNTSHLTDIRLINSDCAVVGKPLCVNPRATSAADGPVASACHYVQLCLPTMFAVDALVGPAPAALLCD